MLLSESDCVSFISSSAQSSSNVCGDDLTDQLHQVARVRVSAAGSMVIGFKKLFYKSCKTCSGRESFDEKQPSVRRKIAAVEIDFDLLIAFK